jgi:hypothetical protein
MSVDLTLGLILRKSIALLLFLVKPLGEIGILTLPHHIDYINTFNTASQNAFNHTSLVVSSRTTLLSFGVLPVLRPDDTERAPL